MIVVDTNVAVYSLIEGDKTGLARRAHDIDPEWRLPTLWRHEFLSVLALYAQRGGLSFKEAVHLLETGIHLFSRGEHSVDMTLALRLAVDHRVSSYDAQFAALAQTLNITLVTEDKALLKAFPRIAVSLHHFCSKA